ncbi:beta-ketoacyl-CoA synthase [Angomonas deanei]|uniref:Elongation of fatty acids protein n=1 Tax=Angomonas deanei TaxID=59799 RepID=A0A7G2CM18_9TRYP|nr:beta-ketoacyl-CoA synthase [Angomonas deanei]CAD2219302.1 GNS1/SUR4 family, putative [Angomonas deanei]|eukprot:EPY32271.1 beta-ketoacyl-CoA synthase [Angomonas deanei]
MDLVTHQLQSMADKINFPELEVWVEDYVDIPIVAVAAYLWLVMYVHPKIMKDRPAFNLKGLNMIWNLLLTVFSFVGAFYCIPRLYELLTADVVSLVDVGAIDVQNASPSLRRHLVYDAENKKLLGIEGSFETSTCVYHPMLYRRGVSGLLSVAFMFSKIPEMLDTVFLVLQKKPLVFLHWYHHITVMLYCWHSWISVVPSGIWFTTMNYFVHTVMYFYYFLASCGYGKAIRPVAPLITFLQIAQMVVGTFITVLTFFKAHTAGGCDVNIANNKLAIIMYASYFYLFAQFFVKRYLTKPAKKAETAAKKVE